MTNSAHYRRNSDTIARNDEILEYAIATVVGQSDRFPPFKRRETSLSLWKRVPPVSPVYSSSEFPCDKIIMSRANDAGNAAGNNYYYSRNSNRRHSVAVQVVEDHLSATEAEFGYRMAAAPNANDQLAADGFVSVTSRKYR